MDQFIKTQNGKIGEVLVELELLKRGWHVERLDGSSKAINGDLIVIKQALRHVIQVKSTFTTRYATFGHATRFLETGDAFFNHSTNDVVVADFLVTVANSPEDPIFHVFKINDAEMLAREAATNWFATPKRDGTKRSPSFPVGVLAGDLRLEQHLDAWQILH